MGKVISTELVTQNTALEWRARSSMIIHDLSPLKTPVFALAEENESNVFLTSCRLNAKKRRSKKPLGPGDII